MSSKIINEVLWQSPNKKWTLRRKGLKSHPITRIDDGWRADYPIKYDDGSIGYDNPEIIPKYVQEAIQRVL